MDRDASLPEGFSHRLTAETFNKMIEADLFAWDDRVGLWDGFIYQKMPRGYAHHMLPTVVLHTLLDQLPDGWFVGWEQSVELGAYHLPLVDLVVVQGRPDRYRDHWPRPDEIALVLEWVRDGLRIHPQVKLAGFAEAGVPSYWALDLDEHVIRTHEGPSRDERRYAREAVHPLGQPVPLRLGDEAVIQIPTIDLIPFC